MCTICNSNKRADIENAILALTSEAPTNELNTIDKIAETFEVPLEELKLHAIFHTPLTSTADIAKIDEAASAELNKTDKTSTEPRDSLTRKMKLREADLLSAVSNEYLVTLKAMGRRINKLIAVRNIDVEDEEQLMKCAKLLTKPMVEMYIGLGGEIRQTVSAMAELNQKLNGPEDSVGSGMIALAQAIRSSSESDG